MSGALLRETSAAQHSVDDLAVIPSSLLSVEHVFHCSVPRHYTGVRLVSTASHARTHAHIHMHQKNKKQNRVKQHCLLRLAWSLCGLRKVYREGKGVTDRSLLRRISVGKIESGHATAFFPDFFCHFVLCCGTRLAH